MHDTQTKRYRYRTFFQHECFLEVRVPWMKLPDGSVRLIDPPWAGRLSGVTLLFEGLVLSLFREKRFSAVARPLGESGHQFAAIAERYVDLDLALAKADNNSVRELAIDETSRDRGYAYVTLAANAERRAAIFVTEARETPTIERLAENLRALGGDLKAVGAVSLDMLPAYIRGVAEHLPNAVVTSDKYNVITHASHALDLTRRADLDALLAHLTTKGTVRA